MSRWRSWAFGVLVWLACSGGVQAKALSMVLPINTAPWSIDETQPAYLHELANLVAEHLKIEIEIEYSTLGRLESDLKQYDILGWGDHRFGTELKTRPVGYLWPMVVTREVKVEQLEALRSLRVVGFKGAKKVWPSVAELSAENPRYVEYFDQRKQVDALFLERADALILDIFIFNYWTEHGRLSGDQRYGIPVFMTPLSELAMRNSKPLPLGYLIHDKDLRRRVNRALSDLEKNGSYPKLRKKWGVKVWRDFEGMF